MVEHHTKKTFTRKAKKDTKAPKNKVLGLKKLRQAFDSMEAFVNRLKPKVKHSFQDAVSEYREEWRRHFKSEITPADAAAYLKFKFGLKGKQGMTRRGKMRGGAAFGQLSGASLSSTETSPGVTGTYGNFPSYQLEGLDRSYQSALSADCGKPNGFPTDGSAAQAGGAKKNSKNSQAGGAASVNWDLGTLFRAPLAPSVSQMYDVPYKSYMTNVKGVYPAYPSSDPVQAAPTRVNISSYLTNDQINPLARATVKDIYRP